jgi:hypothetical protein
MRAKPAAAAATAGAAPLPTSSLTSSNVKVATSTPSVDPTPLFAGAAPAAAAASGSKGPGLLSRVTRRSIDQHAQKSAAAAAAAAADGVVLCDRPDGYIELGGADYDWNTNVEEMAAQVSALQVVNSVVIVLQATLHYGVYLVTSHSMQLGH